MQFCPKCGSVLIPRRKNFGCTRCNYTTHDKIKIEVREKIAEGKEVGVVKEKDIDVMPIVSEQCPKCDSDVAYFWTSQTRAGDESETKFFRCKKCGHTWRDYK